MPPAPRRVLPVLLALAIAVGAAVPVMAGPTPADPVKVDPEVWEDFPAPGSDGVDELFAWTADGERTRRRFNAFLQVNDGPRIRVNPENTRGYSGSIWNGRDRLVWQQVKRGQSDIRMYDVSAGGQVPLGRSDVNDDLWQWRPTVDGDHLLYGENRFDSPDAPWKIVLANLADPGQRARVLATAKNRCRCLFPGQVSGNYATWTRCSPVCQVFVHQIDTATTTRVANDPERQQYFGVPNANGVVYLVRSGSDCGANAQIVALAYGSEGRQLVYAVEEGKDVNDLSTIPGATTPEDLYFSRFGCGRTGQGNIYVVPDVVPPTRLSPPGGREVTGRKDLPMPLGATPSRRASSPAGSPRTA